MSTSGSCRLDGRAQARRWVRFWRWMLAVVLVAGCASDGGMEPAADQGCRSERAGVVAAPTKASVQAAPPELRAAYIAAVQAGASQEYRVERAGAGWVARNPGQEFSAAMTVAGVRVAPREGSTWAEFSLALERFGCEGELRAVEAAEPEAAGNRVQYRRGAGLWEWYVNGPLGLEQGFTVEAAPGCQGKGKAGVVFKMSVGGDVSAAVLEDGGSMELRNAMGRRVARYTDLHVADAKGRVLQARLGVDGDKLNIRVDDTGVTYPLVVDPLIWVQQAELIASDGAANDSLGYSVAISGDTAVVGAYTKASSKGAAYVFVRSGNTWAQQQELLASDGTANDYFGTSVAVSGDTAVVGAPDKAGQGATYVFVRSGSVWTQQQKLLASDGAANDHFGRSVAVSGDTAVVGAWGQVSGQGAAYVFVRSGTTWTQQQKLLASDGAAGHHFGFSVAVSGDTSVIGTLDAPTPRAAYVFVRAGTTWTQQQKLLASNGAANDSFGYSVAVSGDSAVVGAWTKAAGQGAAYVFVRSVTTWTQQQELLASNGAAGDSFGISVAVSGETVLVGAAGKASNQGSAYVFVRSGATWIQQQELTASDGAASNQFGVSVAVSGYTAVVGADGKASHQGSAYAFAPLSNGDVCAMPTQCASGFCVDGVCCATACDGQCEACDGASPGVCSPVTGAPHGSKTPCKGTAACVGVCDGSNTMTCVYPTATQQCATACDDASLTVGVCDGQGSCAPVGTKIDCSPYVCSDSGCKTSCVSVDDCVVPNVCDAKTQKCIPPTSPVAPSGCACSLPGFLSAQDAGGLAAAIAGVIALLRRRRSRVPSLRSDRRAARACHIDTSEKESQCRPAVHAG